MATTNTYKGFIKQVDVNGNTSIVLPITRGELVLDSSGNLAFRSEDFVATAGTYNPTTKSWEGGEIGLMSYLHAQDIENIKRILEEEIGVGGNSEDSLSSLLQALKELVGNPEDTSTTPTKAATGLFKYVDDQLKAHMAANDAMEYKGTVGSETTLKTLPTENVTNGNTYKVVGNLMFNPDGTTGNANKVLAKTGDLIVALVDESDNVIWTLIPSGDDTLIKALGDTNDPLYGVVTLKGNDGITITQNTNTGEIIISGQSTSVSGNLEELSNRIQALEDEIANAVVSGDNTGLLLVEEGVYTNDDKLVKSKAVREIALNLATHIATALDAIKLDLTTTLTSELRSYVSGAINI